jgi:hypothetical protein
MRTNSGRYVVGSYPHTTEFRAKKAKEAKGAKEQPVVPIQ